MAAALNGDSEGLGGARPVDAGPSPGEEGLDEERELLLECAPPPPPPSSCVGTAWCSWSASSCSPLPPGSMARKIQTDDMPRYSNSTISIECSCAAPWYDSACASSVEATAAIRKDT